MVTLLADLTPLVLGALFVWWGGGGLLSRLDERRVADSALNHLIRDVRLTSIALRTAAIVTWVVGVGLLAAPTARQPALGSALIGIGLVTYVGYAMVTELEPTPWRTYVRAGLVGAGGLLATEAASPWWATMADRPIASISALMVAVAALATLSVYRRPGPVLRLASTSTADNDRLHRIAG
ncbi:MAG TPA: hypothetical protein VEX15_24120 [Nocardioidaceae bacterium]|nr:hypothetical protein [Nocardioidaceae bacterium]